MDFLKKKIQEQMQDINLAEIKTLKRSSLFAQLLGNQLKKSELKAEKKITEVFRLDRYPFDRKINALIAKTNEINADNSDKFHDIKEKSIYNKFLLKKLFKSKAQPEKNAIDLNNQKSFNVSLNHSMKFKEDSLELNHNQSANQFTTTAQDIRKTPNKNQQRLNIMNKKMNSSTQSLQIQKNPNHFVITQQKRYHFHPQLAKLKLSQFPENITLDKILFNKQDNPKLLEFLNEILIKFKQLDALFKQNNIRHFLKDLNEFLLIFQGKTLQYYKLYLTFLIAVMNIYKNMSDYDKFVTLLHEYKNIMFHQKDRVNKIRFYKKYAKYKIEIKQYEKALKYLNKLVLGSWEFKFKDYEFKAYDLFGLCYYYKGNIKKAIFFHDKMSNGDLETDRALVKQYGMQFQKKKQKLLANKFQFLVRDGKCKLSSDEESKDQEFELPWGQLNENQMKRLEQQKIANAHIKEMINMNGYKDCNKTVFIIKQVQDSKLQRAKLQVKDAILSGSNKIVFDKNDSEYIMNRSIVSPMYLHQGQNRGVSNISIHEKYKDLQKQNGIQEPNKNLHYLSIENKEKITKIFSKHIKYLFEQIQAGQTA